jgi:hypothetical protein
VTDIIRTTNNEEEDDQDN